jgi:hypothetical protein
MDKTNISFGTLPLAILAIWLNLGAPKKLQRK